MSKDAPVRVNRAPVLTLWAAVVAERLGHPEETALSLGSAVAGTAARAKARRLGIVEERNHAEPRKAPASVPSRRMVHLLGREVPVVETASGLLLAADAQGRPAGAAPVRNYLARAFGERLAETRTAMEALAKAIPPEELNRIAFHLYERFRPEVPEGARGWGAKGELHIDRIASART